MLLRWCSGTSPPRRMLAVRWDDFARSADAARGDPDRRAAGAAAADAEQRRPVNHRFFRAPVLAAR